MVGTLVAQKPGGHVVTLLRTPALPLSHLEPVLLSACASQRSARQQRNTRVSLPVWHPCPRYACLIMRRMPSFALSIITGIPNHP